MQDRCPIYCPQEVLAITARAAATPSKIGKEKREWDQDYILLAGQGDHMCLVKISSKM
jgi:hypothetical protein